MASTSVGRPPVAMIAGAVVGSAAALLLAMALLRWWLLRRTAGRKVAGEDWARDQMEADDNMIRERHEVGTTDAVQASRPVNATAGAKAPPKRWSLSTWFHGRSSNKVDDSGGQQTSDEEAADSDEEYIRGRQAAGATAEVPNSLDSEPRTSTSVQCRPAYTGNHDDDIDEMDTLPLSRHAAGESCQPPVQRRAACIGNHDDDIDEMDALPSSRNAAGDSSPLTRTVRPKSLQCWQGGAAGNASPQRLARDMSDVQALHHAHSAGDSALPLPPPPEDGTASGAAAATRMALAEATGRLSRQHYDSDTQMPMDTLQPPSLLPARALAQSQQQGSATTGRVPAAAGTRQEEPPPPPPAERPEFMRPVVAMHNQVKQ
jgi:hypothetical protein